MIVIKFNLEDIDLIKDVNMNRLTINLEVAEVIDVADYDYLASKLDLSKINVATVDYVQKVIKEIPVVEVTRLF